MLSEILKAEQLIPIALRQGVSLSEAEADLVLGYLEGHDYVLLSDGQARTVRHDLQRGNDHWEDEPYSVQDAIRFSLEMSGELLQCAEQVETLDEAYLSSLRNDGSVLSDLLDRIPGGFCA